MSDARRWRHSDGSGTRTADESATGAVLDWPGVLEATGLTSSRRRLERASEHPHATSPTPVCGPGRLAEEEAIDSGTRHADPPRPGVSPLRTVYPDSEAGTATCIEHNCSVSGVELDISTTLKVIAISWIPCKILFDESFRVKS